MGDECRQFYQSSSLEMDLALATKLLSAVIRWKARVEVRNADLVIVMGVLIVDRRDSQC